MKTSFKALLLLDVVDSTRFIQRVGSRKSAQVFFYHDKLVRTMIYRFNGIEIDKTDGFLVIFDRTIDAVNFALAYHQSIPARTGFKARIGIHWGEVVLKKNKKIYVDQGAKRIEVEGLAKPIGARIMSLASGGQVLLSTSARRASENRLNSFTPKGAHFKSLGSYRLKGVKNPMMIHAVGFKPSDFALPKENEKVKRVNKPKWGTDWSGSDYLRFLRQVLGFILFVYALWLISYTVWTDCRWIYLDLFDIDLRWFGELKEAVLNFLNKHIVYN